MKKGRYDIIVVGGGASGLMAAIWAARKGRQVLILDHHPVPAKKLLVTGNGKCNFTNKMQGSDCYRCGNPAFVLHILEQFSAKDTIAFFEELGILTKERLGYCYPRNGQASAIRNALISEAIRLNIDILNEIGIRLITKEDMIFRVDTKSGDFYADKCILATGGKASPKTGSDGSGYIYAKKLGHGMIPPLPALVPLIGEATWLKSTAGVRCDATVTLLVDGCEIFSDTGEVQMTDYGISGIPVFQVSRFASGALSEKRQVSACLDFLPEISETDLKERLYHLFCMYGSEKDWEEILSGLINNKISTMLCKELHLAKQTTGNPPEHVVKKQAERIAHQLKNTGVPIKNTKGFEQAQVTSGGIPLAEIRENTMESKLVSGLYFAGEIVDVDGICGGYNLQWAWSSGYVAGVAAASD